MTYLIGRMIPPGLSGDIHKVKSYFVLLVITLVIGLLSGVIYYYAKGNDTDDAELMRMRAEMDTYSQLGDKSKKK